MTRYSSNIWIDGHDLLKGFLGLDWFPSDAAKENQRRWERGIVGLLNKVQGPAPGYWVVRETQGARKQLTIKPWVPDSAREEHGITQSITNPYGDPDSIATASPAGQTAHMKDIDDPKDREIPGLGGGSNYTMRFSFYGRPRGPAFDHDEVFFHELIHAMNAMKGEMTMAAGAPDQFDGLEEFTAVVVTNVYSSWTNRPLRLDHNGHAPFPANSPLLNPQNFYNKYKVACQDVKKAHPDLINIYRSWGPSFVPWNPFYFCV